MAVVCSAVMRTSPLARIMHAVRLSVFLSSDWLKIRPIRPFTVANCAMALMTISSSLFSAGSAFSVGFRLKKFDEFDSFAGGVL